MVDGDKFSVSSLEEGFTLGTFTKTDGTMLNLFIYDSDDNTIGIQYMNSAG